jgi:hypothetical protein
MTERTEPTTVAKSYSVTLPRWLFPTWLMKRLGATVEEKQTLEGVEEDWTLKKEYRIGD